MEHFLTVNTVASILNVHHTTARALIKSQRISSVKIGGAYRIREKALNEYIRVSEAQAIVPALLKR